MAPGELLRQRRRAHGVSQRSLALRAGTRQSTISRVENGHEIPTVERFEALFAALGEQLHVSIEAMDPERPSGDIAADRAKTMGQRLEDGFALAAFASRLAGTARP